MPNNNNNQPTQKFNPPTEARPGFFEKRLPPQAYRVCNATLRGFTRVMGVAGRVAAMLALTGILTGAFLGLFGMVYISKCLEVDTDINLETINLDQASHLYAHDPKAPPDKEKWVECSKISGEENRIWVSYKNIPQDLINAAVAIEDKRFWSHNGVEWKRTMGAFVGLFMGSDDQYGGSSITQQLIKNLTNEREATVNRKLTEIFRALEFEKKYSKEQILEWYLNTVYFGRGSNGVLTAAETYFNKPLKKLTAAECAAIIGITNNPSKFDPFNHPEDNHKRQQTILKEMFDQNLLTEEEYNKAADQELKFSQKQFTEQSTRSWYEDQAVNDLVKDIMRDWGYSKQLAQQFVLAGGVNIYMCVDLNLQKIMDDVWTDPENWPATPDDEPPESAMMITDPYTGDIKAMIGGREKTGISEWDRSTIAKRQPGSTIKPLSIYAPGFELGKITPYTPLDDMPLRVLDGHEWPRNQPRGYSGRMPVLEGVALSRNTIALQTLQRIGVEDAFSFAKNTMGLSTLVEDVTVGDKILSDVQEAPLAFGALTYGVTVRDMCGGYNTFVNGGTRYKTRTYSHITDKDGNILYENPNNPVVVLQEKSAWYMTSCLENAVKNGTGKPAQFRKNMHIAGKTGTTSDDKDRWFAGYTPYYVGICWFGYDVPREMSGYASNPAVTMWKQVMEKAHETFEDREFTPLSGAVQAEYCIDSGMAPSDACRRDIRGSRVHSGVFAPEDVPTEPCTLHVTTDVCTLSGKIATPNCPAVTRKKAAFLNLKRSVPISGFYLPDEQYTLRIWPDKGYSVDHGYAPGGGGGANGFCTYDHGANVAKPSAAPTSKPTAKPTQKPSATDEPEATDEPDPTEKPEATEEPPETPEPEPDPTPEPLPEDVG